MPEILTDAYLLFTFVFKQALILPSNTIFPKVKGRFNNNQYV